MNQNTIKATRKHFSFFLLSALIFIISFLVLYLAHADLFVLKPVHAISWALQVVVRVEVDPLAIIPHWCASTTRVRLSAWQCFTAIMTNSISAPFLFYIFQMPS